MLIWHWPDRRPAMSALGPKPVDEGVVVQGVWAAKAAWGRARPELDAKLKEGQEECNICFEAAIDVKFMPCKHGACTACVDSLRAAAVFKPDAGVKCPYCRQFVDGFSSLTGEYSSLPNLRDANKAAKAAAAAREASTQQKSLHEVRQPGGAAVQNGPPQVWHCVDCGKINYGFSPRCHRCNKAAPRQSQPTGKDVLQCNHEEIYHFACRKYHPDFNQAFKEAGMPFNTDEARLGGTHDTVVAAMQVQGHKRLLHIVACIAGHGKIWNLITNVVGNYTLQDLLQATSKLRLAAQDPSIVKSGLTGKVLTGLTNGKDAFGQLQSPILERASELLKHPQGFYVLDKILQLSSGADLLPFAAALFSRHTDVIFDKWYMRAVVKVIDRLVETALGEAGREAAQAGDELDRFCRYCCTREAQLVTASSHFQSGQMLVEAIQGALPRDEAVKMARMIARHALQLAWGSKMGVATLQSLMALRSFDDKSAEQVITIICWVAESLEGNVAETAMRVELDGHRLIQNLVEQLAASREGAWVFSVATEMVAGANEYQSRPSVMSVLAFALAQPVLGDEQLNILLQELQQNTGDVQSVLASTNEIRSKQHPDLPPLQLQAPPPPLSPAAPASADRSSPGQPPPLQPSVDPFSMLPASRPSSSTSTVHSPPAVSPASAGPPGKHANGLVPDRSAELSALLSGMQARARAAAPASTAASQQVGGLPLVGLAPAIGLLQDAYAACNQDADAMCHGNIVEWVLAEAALLVPPFIAAGMVWLQSDEVLRAAAHPDPSNFFPPAAPPDVPAPVKANMASFLPHMLGSLAVGTTTSAAQQDNTSRAASPMQYQPTNALPSALHVHNSVDVLDGAASAPADKGTAGWACSVCTYEHTGSEADFLACAMCCQPRRLPPENEVTT